MNIIVLGAFRAVGCVALGWLLLIGNQACADDVNPPSWRGQPQTTFAEWTFPNDFSPVAPNNVVNANGVPLAEMFFLDWDSVFSGSWFAPGPPSQGGGNIVLDIPNWIDDDPVKLIQIQMTVQGFIDGDTGEFIAPEVGLIVPSNLPSGGSFQVTHLSTTDMPIGNPVDGLTHRTELWRIRENPDFEQITIDVPVDTLVSQIVVDTISMVPEPSSILLILLGLLMVPRLAPQR